MVVDVGLFIIQDVIIVISDKMVVCYFYVFGGDGNDFLVEEQEQCWEVMKVVECVVKKEICMLDGVVIGLFVLLWVVKFQKWVVCVGFDWLLMDQVLDKIIEELKELVEVCDMKLQVDVEEEFGDLLFVMVNLVCYFGVEFEGVLWVVNVKFICCFNGIEDELVKIGKVLIDSNLVEMDVFWDKVKVVEKKVD